MNCSNTIFLIGFMGTGKSTVARELKKRLNLELVEMDEQIVKEQNMSINEIFSQYGEPYFRDLETKMLEELKDKSPSVVSCGGGVVLREENREHMHRAGRIVLLTATPETIYERVKRDTGRPILNKNMTVEHIQELMEKRRVRYESSADVTIETDGKSTSQICNEIMAGLEL